MSTIALLTDFGDSDGFVGMMKAVILGINPECSLVDLCHGIASFNIAAAAFILEKSVRYFPQGTIFLAVVDPGVGSERRIIAAETGGYNFVAPDNGVLSRVLAHYQHRTVVAVENQEFFLSPHSVSFHGRDILAPVAAQLSRGVTLKQLGPVIDSYKFLKSVNLLKHSDHVIGEIVHIDKFGNMISNISSDDLPQCDDVNRLKCTVGGTKEVPFVQNYQAAQGLSALLSGYGTVEVFLYQGNAASRFDRPIGTTIAIELRS